MLCKTSKTTAGVGVSGKSRGKGQAAAIKIDGRAKDKGACL